MATQPVPQGFHTVTPFFVVKGAAEFLQFLVQGFGAVALEQHEGPQGGISHAIAQIGDSRVMLGEVTAHTEARPASLYLYVADTDATYAKALGAGAKSILAPTDQFYGDRNAGVTDAWGNQWWIATHQEDVAPEELDRRMKARTTAQV